MSTECFGILFHQAFLCPPQHLQTTSQWWQRTLRHHSVDTKPRISLLSVPQKEENQPHRWVAAEDPSDLPSQHIDPCCLQRKRNSITCSCQECFCLSVCLFVVLRNWHTGHFKGKKCIKWNLKISTTAAKSLMSKHCTHMQHFLLADTSCATTQADRVCIPGCFKQLSPLPLLYSLQIDAWLISSTNLVVWHSH